MLFISAPSSYACVVAHGRFQEKFGKGVCRLEHHRGFQGSVCLDEEVYFFGLFKATAEVCSGERAACVRSQPLFFPLADALRFSEQRRAFPVSPRV